MTLPTRSSKTVVPITDGDRETALKFAQQQPTREKAMQVYRNTLAVLAAKQCLDWLEMPTDVPASDGWNPFTRLAADVADLPVPGLGSLECRPVSPEAQYCYVPAEVLENRLAYLVVQLDPSCQTATMLGFAPSAIGESLPLEQLQPLEALLIHLELLGASSFNTLQPSLLPVNQLSQWLQQVSDAGKAMQQSLPNERVWQPVEALLGTLHEPAFAFRSFQPMPLETPERIQQLVEQLYAGQSFGVLRSDFPTPVSDPDLQAALVHLMQTTTDEETRWKTAELLWTIDPSHPASGVRRVLDLGLLLASHHLALMVAVLQIDAQRLSVLVRVYPLAEQVCLPSGLQLAIVGADGSLGLKTEARERDNYIQLKLRGELGEPFSIRLHLGHDVLTEHFVL